MASDVVTSASEHLGLPIMSALTHLQFVFRLPIELHHPRLIIMFHPVILLTLLDSFPHLEEIEWAVPPCPQGGCSHKNFRVEYRKGAILINNLEKIWGVNIRKETDHANNNGRSALSQI